MNGGPRTLVHRFIGCLTLALAPAVFGDGLKERMGGLKIRLETDHYRLAGTATDSRLREYGEALDFIHAEYARGFGELIDQADEPSDPAADQQVADKSDRSKSAAGRTGQRERAKAKGGKADPGPGKVKTSEPNEAEPQDDKFPVIIFRERREYEEFGRQYLSGGSEHTDGMFIPSLKLLLILDQSNNAETHETLFHEAFHQFLYRYVDDPPMWLNEGLATYYGTAKPVKGGLSFREPDPKRWQLVRRALDKKQTLPLCQVLRASRREFYDRTPVRLRGYENVTNASLYYNQSYTFVHLLLADATGRKRLRDYILALSRSTPAERPKLDAEFFGEECVRLEQRWIEHVRSRPENR